MKAIQKLTKTARQVGRFFAAEHVAFAPFLPDLKRYSLPKFRQDAWSAANVTMLALAQGIAFAAIAGLPVVYGIVSTAVAAFTAPFLRARDTRF
ncbi:MAG: hypothetical protein HC845_04345 [Akkermansiaceae bacterium]|nr:hypothetical protein [Akkermansiaceae bacterium]